jgi:hypothetical protein
MTNSLLGAMQMSDMLEQAIIDAEALREAATKNAETLILEKYSNQIKGAVESLLEQDDLMAALDSDIEAAPEGGVPGMDAPAAPEVDASPSSVMEHIPLAVTSENDDQVEIPLDKLMEEITNLNQSLRFDGDFINDEDLFEHNLNEESDEDLDEDLDEGKHEELDEELDEDVDIDENILEALTVDIHPTKSGWAGTPESYMTLAEEELLALEQDSEVREEKDALRKAVRALETVNETITKQNSKLTTTLNESSKYMTKLRDVVVVLEEKLDKANMVNAKLLYQNKALNSDSLNERQKQKLVEAVSNAETIEEAKVIFETLQNTVGSTSRKQQPNSLSEAVQKSSSVILSARKENSVGQKQDPTLDRWKFLAGIDKTIDS